MGGLWDHGGSLTVRTFYRRNIFGNFNGKLTMLPMKIWNFKLGKFGGIVAYGFGQVDNKIN